jgi:hypothetical protein
MSRLEQLLAGTLVLIALAVAGWFGLDHYGAARYQAGYAKAVDDRAQADAKAVLVRAGENKAKAAQQATDNTTITKEKDDEIAALRARLAAAPRLRVGAAVCPDRPATAAHAEGAASSDSPNPSARVVSAAADRDFKQLIQDVEQDLATGRACQAFLQKNGLEP